MTTAATWTTGFAHATDADFRTWGKEISDKLQTMTGLTKVAETGTVNWATVTRPGANTEGGFEVYYLNDSLHGTAPIYIRVSYGTGSSTTYPGLSITVGTSTNGSGVLGGTTTTIKRWNKNSAATAGNHVSYLCVKEGYFGLAWKISAASAGVVVVCRSCDADGTPNGKAAALINTGVSTYCVSQTLRFESVAAVIAEDSGGNLACVPGYPTTSAVGADYQVYMCWMNATDVRPIFGMCALLVADYPTSSSISVALVGTTARTYVSVGGAMCYPGCGSRAGFGIIYE
jgi:hypothetical protein